MDGQWLYPVGDLPPLLPRVKSERCSSAFWVYLPDVHKPVNEICRCDHSAFSGGMGNHLGFFKPKSMKRNENLLREGQVCTSIAFINQGILVHSKRLKSGEEGTTDFALASDWVTDNRSRLSHTTSQISIKAITPAELLVISAENLNQCYRLVPKTERLGRILIEQAFVRIALQSIFWRLSGTKNC
jgi:hypothetical protein